MCERTPYDIHDNLPELVGLVQDEEITILTPSLVERVLAVGKHETGNDSGALCKSEHR